MPVIKILRPIGDQDFLSANIFEKYFRKYVGSIAKISSISYTGLYRDLVKNEKLNHKNLVKASKRLERITRGYQYICCSNDAILMIPLILTLRNISNIDLRLMIISHSPGMYLYEWAMAGPLLQKGDIIIAQSKNGYDVIKFFYPTIAQFITQVHLPLPFLREEIPSQASNKTDILVTLSRIHEDKLIHRQIEAMSILKKKFRIKAKMLIAGSLGDKDTGEETVYVRLLKNKIKRLKLHNSVQFIGPLYTVEEKAEFLSKARISINLSACLEESYPKATIEALGMGVPVIATNWNGMRDTVGNAGILIDMEMKKNGHVDIDPEKIANAIEKLLRVPIPRIKCRTQASKFTPHIALKIYKKILNQNLKYKDFSKSLNPTYSVADKFFYKKGLLSKNPFINVFTYKELFEIYWKYLNVHIKKKTGLLDNNATLCLGERLHGYLLLSLKKISGLFFANLEFGNLLKLKTVNFIMKFNPDTVSSLLVKKLIQFSDMEITLLEKEMLYASVLHEGEVHVFQKMNFDDLKRNASSIAYKYLLTEKLIIENKYEEAYDFFKLSHEKDNLQEYDAVFIKQICKIIEFTNQPEVALSWIDNWLQLYPDSPNSGEIWLRKAFVAFKCGDSYHKLAKSAIKITKQLYPNDSIVQSLEEKIMNQM